MPNSNNYHSNNNSKKELNAVVSEMVDHYMKESINGKKCKNKKDAMAINAELDGNEDNWVDILFDDLKITKSKEAKNGK